MQNLFNFPQKGELIDNRYLVIEEIGAGSFAKVLKVKDTKLEIFKALKIFTHKDTQKTAFEDLQIEAKNLAKINHKNVVSIYDFKQNEDYFYIEMEFVDGENLHNKIIEKKINNKNKLALQIAKGIQAIHKKGIIHHDIKPENIIVTKEKKVKITDFGISSKLNYNENYGSLAFAAPEKFKKVNQSKSVDIFSFGVTLYQLYYNKHPFKIDGDKITYKTPENLKKPKDKISKIIAKCLKIQPEERYQDFRSIIKDLQKKELLKTPKNKESTIKQDIKKLDLRAVLILSLLLIILIPSYIIFLLKLFESGIQKVYVDAEQHIIYRDYQKLGSTSKKYKFSNGNIIQFKDKSNNLLYQFTYSGEQKIIIDFKDNKVYKNNKLVGQKIYSKQDLPISEKVNYIYTNIELQTSDFPIKKNITVVFNGDNALSGLSNIPKNIINLHFTNINQKIIVNNINNNKIKELSFYNCFVNINQVERFSQLNSLEFQSTKISNPHHIYNLKNLEKLSLKETNIKSLKNVSNLSNLKKLSLSENRFLEKIEEVNDISSLETMYTSNKSYVKQIKSVDILEQKTIKNIGLPFWFKMIISLISFTVIVFTIWLFIWLSARESNKIENDAADSKNKENLKNKEDDKEKNQIDFKQINSALKENKFSIPKKKSALFLLKENEECFENKQKFKIEKKKILKNYYIYLNDKISNQLFGLAFEEVSRGLEIIKDKKLNKIRKKIIKKMQHISPIKMKKIKGDKFQMGDFTAKTQRIARPLHTVTISDFEISETMITNKQFCEFLNKSKINIEKHIKLEDSYIEKIKNKFVAKTPYESYPVYNISWHAANAFCKWFDGRLPTEAEWEYLARNGGKSILYTTGKSIDNSQANFLVDKNDDSWHSVKSVKSYPHNELGLYELCGNLLEWCKDDYEKEYYYNSEKINPVAVYRNGLKVIRGGAWCFSKTNMITFYRGFSKDTSKTNFIGFRVARDI